MRSKFNKKKIIFLPSFKLIKYLIFFLFLFSISYFAYYELKKNDRFYYYIEYISQKFNYQFINLELNNLERVEKAEVIKIINKYLEKSIFLIPLKDISNSLNDLNWVKKVNLSTNLKNKIKVEIFEYKPIGLFYYNKKLFYFSKEGKIIEKKITNDDEQFIIFSGKNVLKKANDLLKILDSINEKNFLSINEAFYVNERRWDIKLNNNILINLSEKNIEDSIKNYIRLIEKLNNIEIDEIKKIDLRNNKKAIISFKE